MKIRFYTLLYADLSESRQLQGKKRSARQRIAIFIKNAILLDKSLRATNPECGSLTILTNHIELISDIIDECGYTGINVIQIDFSLPVPAGIPFYSAHYKIDAFNYFASLPDDQYSVLLDNDIVFLRPLPQTFYEITERRIPLCYHLPVGDCDKMMADCRKISSDTDVPTWTGGELWGGVNHFYSKLYKECLSVTSSYFSVIDNNFFHIGDEMLTSLAFARMKNRGLEYLDAGMYRFIHRYWGMHERQPIQHFNPVLAHLPADKVWIAESGIDNKPFVPSEFIARYNRHLRLFRFLNKIRNAIKI